MELPNGLLDAVKNDQDITWADSADDKKITGIIMRGIRYLDTTAGMKLDYTCLLYTSDAADEL